MIVEGLLARFADREKEMYRRFQAWEASSKTIPIFGSTEQALADVRPEIETTKDVLLTTDQDVGNKYNEISIWIYRFETAEKELIRKDKLENPAVCFLSDWMLTTKIRILSLEDAFAASDTVEKNFTTPGRLPSLCQFSISYERSSIPLSSTEPFWC